MDEVIRAAVTSATAKAAVAPHHPAVDVPATRAAYLTLRRLDVPRRFMPERLPMLASKATAMHSSRIAAHTFTVARCHSSTAAHFSVVSCFFGTAITACQPSLMTRKNACSGNAALIEMRSSSVMGPVRRLVARRLARLKVTARRSASAPASVLRSATERRHRLDDQFHHECPHGLRSVAFGVARLGAE